MTFCKMYATVVSESGIELATTNASVASLNFVNPSAYGEAVGAFADENDYQKLAWFCRIVVKPEFRGNGEGIYLMNALTEICDCDRICIINSPNPYNPKDRARLLRFYSKFGFVTYPGFPKDLLLREPRRVSTRQYETEA